MIRKTDAPLQQQIDLRRAEIRTDSYSMSIGEWMSLYEQEELDIHPEFQRIFRWTDLQKSRLIESILLGIPIPPIFVSQQESGLWDVVDGTQRLSTIFQFVGILKDEQGVRVDPLTLRGTDALPALKGKIWEDPDDPEKSLTSAQRLYIKRAKIDVSIILKESDPDAKFELFMRLNTGGSPLSPQEVRNCLLVMINRDLYSWMEQMARDEKFLRCVSLTDRALDERYDLELILRFIVFRNATENELRFDDLNEFLTRRMKEIALSGSIDQKKEEQIFRRTFDILDSSTSEDSFRKYDPARRRFVGSFSVSAFEAIAMGIGHYNGRVQEKDRIAEIAEKIWANPVFTSNSGSGIRASTRIPKTIPLGRGLFSGE